MKTGGELHQRIDRNARRLSAPEYCSPQVFAEGGEWPGDWQGRTILALCSLYRGLNEGEPLREAVFGQLRAILDDLPRRCNEGGYLGELFDGRTINEQQVSGTSWLLRGLCEAYRLTGDPALLERVQRIAESFLIPIGPFYDCYPLQTRETGGVGGHLLGISGSWKLSSDSGCAFMMLDGITQACRFVRDPRLLAAAAHMIGVFEKLDVVGCRCQTHATLSAARGIFRFFKLTGERRYLKLAERLFDCYLEKGSTVNYANFNWFGKPDTWTELCTVVDSLILAAKLFGESKDPSRLRLLNRIYENAVRSAQRTNGGAGCETCLAGERHTLRIHTYEAYFCCSMRLAEGLFELSRAQLFEGEEELTVGFRNDFVTETEKGSFSLSVTEEAGRGRMVCRPPAGLRRLSFYLPGHCSAECSLPFVRDEYLLTLEGPLPEVVEITYRMTPFSEQRKGQTVFFLGDRLLTEKPAPAGAEGYCLRVDGRTLTPLTDCLGLSGKGAELALEQRT